MSIMQVVTGLFKPAADLVGELIEDKDKANQIRASLAMAQHSITSEVIQLEGKVVKAKADIIVAEATSESWITSNWRPVTMLTFVFLVVLKWLGFTAGNISEALELELMSLIQIGLGGYVVGRSLEKVGPSIAAVFSRKE